MIKKYKISNFKIIKNTEFKIYYQSLPKKIDEIKSGNKMLRPEVRPALRLAHGLI